MEPYRERIEDFMRRYGYEGNRVLWVMAVPALVGAILVMMVWLSLEPAGTRETSVDQNDVVWACGRKVLPEYRELAEYRDVARDLARGMREDCGIYGPQAAGTSGD